MSHSKRMELGHRAIELRGQGESWAYVCEQLGVNQRVAAELLNYVKRDQTTASGWYAGMPKRLIQKILANGLKSREQCEQLVNKYGDSLKTTLINWGPQATNDLREWLQTHHTTP